MVREEETEKREEASRRWWERWWESRPSRAERMGLEGKASSRRAQPRTEEEKNDAHAMAVERLGGGTARREEELRRLLGKVKRLGAPSGAQRQSDLQATIPQLAAWMRRRYGEGAGPVDWSTVLGALASFYSRTLKSTATTTTTNRWSSSSSDSISAGEEEKKKELRLSILSVFNELIVVARDERDRDFLKQGDQSFLRPLYNLYARIPADEREQLWEMLRIWSEKKVFKKEYLDKVRAALLKVGAEDAEDNFFDQYWMRPARSLK